MVYESLCFRQHILPRTFVRRKIKILQRWNWPPLSIISGNPIMGWSIRLGLKSFLFKFCQSPCSFVRVELLKLDGRNEQWHSWWRIRRKEQIREIRSMVQQRLVTWWQGGDGKTWRLLIIVAISRGSPPRRSPWWTPRWPPRWPPRRSPRWPPWWPSRWSPPWWKKALNKNKVCLFKL